MAYSGSDLLNLQANIKKDPDGYKDEFQLQYRHYQACLSIFALKPSHEAKEFAELVNFVAQVSKCYPKETEGLAKQLMELLDTHFAVLDPPLRKHLVQALILMRNRNQVDPIILLPLFFRLFRCSDKALRELLFRHIIADIKNSNQKARNERLNRSVQNFLYSLMQDDNEMAAKKSLAVLTELWRRHVWRDARTVNCIASAAFHRSPRVSLAVMKFFLGQDEANADGEDSDDEDGNAKGGRKGGAGAEEVRAVNPSKEEVYKATKKGTKSSKKKKQAKLKRVMNTVKKQTRKDAATTSESFAAVHLLHDPQAFAERLFARLQGGGERYETRLAMMNVTSRVMGVHKLLLLNFYPFLQKYIAPHTRDVTHILAALVQATHDLVPPDTLAPVVKQLVDQFVHDKSRPEVMVIGLRTVRELCVRCPLVMGGDLLQDLALYKKERNKEVASAARGIIGLFRELNPALLAKKDRGRGADLEAAPAAYGATELRDRVEGASLLQRALLTGEGLESSEEEENGDSSDEDEGMESEDGTESGGEDGEVVSDGDDVMEDGLEDGSEDGSEGEEGGSEGDMEAGFSGGGQDEKEEQEGQQAGPSGADDVAVQQQQQQQGQEEGQEQQQAQQGQQQEGQEGDDSGQPSTSGRYAAALERQAGSLADLKRQLAQAKAAKQQQQQQQQQEGEGAADVPLEQQRILTEEDFAAIARLKHRHMVEAAMQKHGLKTASAHKRKRLKAAAEEEADEAVALAEARAKAGERRVDPESLQGRIKRRKNKEERMQSVLAGREDRSFGSSSKLKKAKTGGRSEKEKQKKKVLPVGARIQQLRNRATKARNKSHPRNFKGHMRS